MSDPKWIERLQQAMLGDYLGGRAARRFAGTPLRCLRVIRSQNQVETFQKSADPVRCESGSSTVRASYIFND
jgi:hypothetical protein